MGPLRCRGRMRTHRTQHRLRVAARGSRRSGARGLAGPDRLRRATAARAGPRGGRGRIRRRRSAQRDEGSTASPFRARRPTTVRVFAARSIVAGLQNSPARALRGSSHPISRPIAAGAGAPRRLTTATASSVAAAAARFRVGRECGSGRLPNSRSPWAGAPRHATAGVRVEFDAADASRSLGARSPHCVRSRRRVADRGSSLRVRTAVDLLQGDFARAAAGRGARTPCSCLPSRSPSLRLRCTSATVGGRTGCALTHGAMRGRGASRPAQESSDAAGPRQWRKRARAPLRAASPRAWPCSPRRCASASGPRGARAARAATGHGEDGNVSRRPLDARSHSQQRRRLGRARCTTPAVGRPRASRGNLLGRTRSPGGPVMASPPTLLRAPMPLVRWWSTKSSAERWGVATVVLLAIAAVAWLALWQPLTRDIAALRVANARAAAALVERGKTADEIAGLARSARRRLRRSRAGLRAHPHATERARCGHASRNGRMAA